MYENFISIYRSVEDANQEQSKKFHLKFLQHMACMEDSLSRFVKDLVTFCSGLQTNLGMFRI
jgi:argininosuccinate lyase